MPLADEIINRKDFRVNCKQSVDTGFVFESHCRFFFITEQSKLTDFLLIFKVKIRCQMISN